MTILMLMLQIYALHLIHVSTAADILLAPKQNYVGGLSLK